MMKFYPGQRLKTRSGRDAIIDTVLSETEVLGSGDRLIGRVFTPHGSYTRTWTEDGAWCRHGRSPAGEDLILPPLTAVVAWVAGEDFLSPPAPRIFRDLAAAAIFHPVAIVEVNAEYGEGLPEPAPTPEQCASTALDPVAAERLAEATKGLLAEGGQPLTPEGEASAARAFEALCADEIRRRGDPVEVAPGTYAFITPTTSAKPPAHQSVWATPELPQVVPEEPKNEPREPSQENQTPSPTPLVEQANDGKKHEEGGNRLSSRLRAAPLHNPLTARQRAALKALEVTEAGHGYGITSDNARELLRMLGYQR